MRVRESRLARLKDLMKAHRRLAAGVRPVDTWRLQASRFDPESIGESETLFSVANGYLGMRGTQDEGMPVHDPGVLLNGFHETWPIAYGETAFGFATTGQTIVSVPDGSVIRLYVDEEPFDLAAATLRDYERTLDMRSGILERRVEFETPRGAIVALTSRRLASLESRHLIAIAYEVTLVRGLAKLAVSSELVTTTSRLGPSDDPRSGTRFDGATLAHHMADPITGDRQARARASRRATVLLRP